MAIFVFPSWAARKWYSIYYVPFGVYFLCHLPFIYRKWKSIYIRNITEKRFFLKQCCVLGDLNIQQHPLDVAFGLPL